MDSFTQLCLGAAVGYAVAGKKLGKKALLWGALAGTLPDLDFIPILPFKDDFTYLKYHRGLSHSLIFTAIVPPIVGYVIKKLRPKADYKTIGWIFFWSILTHILLDCFTSWGTQVFWPLANRVAWNSIFIIDPLYTVPLFISLIVGFLSKTHKKTQKSIVFGLIITTFYLFLSLGIKYVINQKFEALYQKHQIPVQRYTSRPSPFNLILWSSTAETDEGYYYAMISLLDRSHQKSLYFEQKNHHLTLGFNSKKTRELLAYTKGYYSVENQEKGILIHDLRYGYMGDPLLNEKHYVFSYHLTKSESGAINLHVKNPRPSNTDELLNQLWQRLKGI